MYILVQAMSALEVSVRYRFLKIVSTTDAPHDKRTAPGCYLDGLGATPIALFGALLFVTLP